MSIYIYIYFFILVNFILFLFFKNFKIEKLLFFITMCILLFFSGTRYFTGVDYDTYLEIFKNVKSDLNFNEIEKLFLFISFIAKNFFKMKLEKIFFLFECINIILLYKLIIKNLNKNLFFALYIWYSFYFLRLNMGQFRFGIAILICLNLISYLYINSYRKFIFGVFMSFFIHKTSIIYLVLLLIRKKIFFIKNLMFYPLIAFCIGKFLITKETLLFVGNFINSVKLRSMVFGNYIYNIGFSFYQVYIIIICIIICNYKTKNQKINFYKKIFLIGVGNYFLFINLAIFSDRLSLIFIAIQTILFPMIFNDLNKKGNKIIFIIFIIFISSYTFLTTLIRSQEYIPYESWLF